MEPITDQIILLGSKIPTGEPEKLFLYASDVLIESGLWVSPGDLTVFTTKKHYRTAIGILRQLSSSGYDNIFAMRNYHRAQFNAGGKLLKSFRGGSFEEHQGAPKSPSPDDFNISSTKDGLWTFDFDEMQSLPYGLQMTDKKAKDGTVIGQQWDISSPLASKCFPVWMYGSRLRAGSKVLLQLIFYHPEENAFTVHDEAMARLLRDALEHTVLQLREGMFAVQSSGQEENKSFLWLMSIQQVERHDHVFEKGLSSWGLGQLEGWLTFRAVGVKVERTTSAMFA